MEYRQTAEDRQTDKTDKHAQTNFLTTGRKGVWEGIEAECSYCGASPEYWGHSVSSLRWLSYKYHQSIHLLSSP